MDGMLNVLKPPGMTSHDVVAYLRRILKQKRIGHTGTLDPAAVGVLPVCLGRATRLAEYLTEEVKAYRAEITFGIATDTADAGGAVLAVKAVDKLTPDMLRQVFRQFTGKIMQIPPMVSAVKYGGKKLYQLAREGKEITREPRPVEIYRLDLVKFFADPAYPRAIFDVVCSKGTYIRTLCADIGDALGCGAHMSFLVRVQAGGLTLAEAVTLPEIVEAVAQNRIADLLIPLSKCLPRLPQVTVTPAAAQLVGNGVAVHLAQVMVPEGNLPPDGIVGLYNTAGELLAIAKGELNEAGKLRFKPLKVFV